MLHNTQKRAHGQTLSSTLKEFFLGGGDSITWYFPLNYLIKTVFSLSNAIMLEK